MAYTVPGTDISVWQDNISTPQHVNFDRMLEAGAKFVFIKTSQATRLDRDYSLNWGNARASGIAVGGYHYLDWTQPVMSQARFFGGVLRADPGDLPPVVDFEENLNCPAGAAGQLEMFCDEVENIIGKRVMIYTSPGFWGVHGSTSLEWLEHKLWVAHYTEMPEPMIPSPWSCWTFWQYTSRGIGPYWGGDAQWIDLNWYAGTQEEFDLEFSVEPPPPTDDEKLARLWAGHPELW